MGESNLSAVLQKNLEIKLENRPIPVPDRHEVQIRMRYVGVCGTDIHLWTEGRVGDMFVLNKPIALGHECSGVISKVGEGVKNVKEGDRVAIEPMQNCRDCDTCASGRYNLCPNKAFLGMPEVNGGLTQYLVVHSSCVFKIPDNLSFEEAALIEPFSVGLHSCRRARVTAGDKVLICGAGPIGLCALLVARASGASVVMVTDLEQSRLDIAKTMGATHTCKVEKDAQPTDVAKTITEMLGCSPNKIIECSAAKSSVVLAVEVVKPGGAIALVGLGSTYVSVPMVDIIVKEIDLCGSAGYASTWPTAIEMISSGQCNVAQLVTHRFTLRETEKAYEMSRSGAGIKVMIDCNPE